MRRDEQRLTDILEALDWIAKGIAGRTEADFLASEYCSAQGQEFRGRDRRLHSPLQLPVVVPW